MRKRGALWLSRCALVVAVTAVGAWIAIPLPGGVPVSLQLVGVLGGGLMLGPVAGGLAQAAYVALGAAGVPVFAGFRAGPAVLAGPSGGYLIGFILGAAVCGALARRRSVPALVGAAVAGVAVIYACGIGGLMVWTGLSLTRAIAVGVVPFVAADAIKVAVAVALTRRVDRLGLLR